MSLLHGPRILNDQMYRNIRSDGLGQTLDSGEDEEIARVLAAKTREAFVRAHLAELLTGRPTHYQEQSFVGHCV